MAKVTWEPSRFMFWAGFCVGIFGLLALIVMWR